jgi:hypothetical protein
MRIKALRKMLVNNSQFQFQFHQHFKSIHSDKKPTKLKALNFLKNTFALSARKMLVFLNCRGKVD